ncbi:MAG: hypothetical protein DLM59_14735 [Pseudonocardiales bacterium]|nr:MAG: hypothetical protein DLM59_14735 [Pseudonocardiales bacterium]
MRATIAVVPPPFAAYLRVYEPLTAFPPDEKEHWRLYIASGRAPARRDGPRLEYEHAVRQILLGRLPDPGEHAFVADTQVADKTAVPLICPWRTALRAGQAAEELATGMAGVLVDSLLPRAIAERAQADLSAWRVKHPHARSHIATATWSVPVRWFVLFSSDERQLQVGDGKREVVYVTEMAKARRRAARALARLRKGLGETDVTDAVEGLARWLEDFHPRSSVELDYGGLAWLFDPDRLREDSSVADVAAALDALAVGDDRAASDAYERVAGRWREAQLAQAAN